LNWKFKPHTTYNTNQLDQDFIQASTVLSEALL
jgi:hypothetical protein